MKIKIKPSAKIKRRYLLIENGNKKLVEKVILDYIGILGWARAAPVFVEDKRKGKGKGIVLAVERKEVDNVKAAFEMCEEKVKVVKVSETLKKLN